MFYHPFVDWLAGSLSSAAFIGFVAYAFRDALSAYFSKAMDLRFAKQLEEAKGDIRAKEQVLEADLRAKESELDKIQEHLSTLKRERSSIVTAKRTEAAEIALRRCNDVSRLLIAAETMKIMKVDAVIERYDDRDLQSFFDMLVTSMKADEILEDLSKQERVLPSLYLSEKARAYLDVYEAIITHAVAFMKLMSIGRDPSSFMTLHGLKEKIVALVPSSEDGFAKFGDAYAYYWPQYFYDKALRALREIVNGAEQDQLDVLAVRELAISAQTTQIEVRKRFEEYAVASDLIVPQEQAAATPTE